MPQHSTLAVSFELWLSRVSRPKVKLIKHAASESDSRVRTYVTFTRWKTRVSCKERIVHTPLCLCCFNQLRTRGPQPLCVQMCVLAIEISVLHQEPRGLVVHFTFHSFVRFRRRLATFWHKLANIARLWFCGVYHCSAVVTNCNFEWKKSRCSRSRMLHSQILFPRHLWTLLYRSKNQGLL